MNHRPISCLSAAAAAVLDGSGGGAVAGIGDDALPPDIETDEGKASVAAASASRCYLLPSTSYYQLQS